MQIADEVITLPFWSKSEVRKSALLILPGQQEYRIPEGVKHWQWAAKHLWVAGTRADPFYSRKKILEIVKSAGIRTGDIATIETGGWANHTPDQMRWAIELLKEYAEVNHLIVCTAEYHLPRCVLCCVKTMQKQEVLRVISPLPIRHQEPFRESAAWNEERAKITVYQEKKDVATKEEWDTYLLWRSRQ